MQAWNEVLEVRTAFGISNERNEVCEVVNTVNKLLTFNSGVVGGPNALDNLGKNPTN